MRATADSRSRSARFATGAARTRDSFAFSRAWWTTSPRSVVRARSGSRSSSRTGEPARALRRDLLDETTRRLGPRRTRDVGLGEDPDEAPVGDDRQPANLLGGHSLNRIVERLVRRRNDGVVRAHVRDRDLVRIEIPGDDVQDEVAVGHHADELVAVDDGERAD